MQWNNLNLGWWYVVVGWVSCCRRRKSGNGSCMKKKLCVTAALWVKWYDTSDLVWFLRVGQRKTGQFSTLIAPNLECSSSKIVFQGLQGFSRYSSDKTIHGFLVSVLHNQSKLVMWSSGRGVTVQFFRFDLVQKLSPCSVDNRTGNFQFKQETGTRNKR